MVPSGEDRLDGWTTEATAVALAGAARSTAADLDKQQVLHRPVGYRIEHVIALALLMLVRPAAATADQLLGFGRALGEDGIADQLSERIKAHARGENRTPAAELPDPTDDAQHVALVAVPRTARLEVANGLEEIAQVHLGANGGAWTYPLAPQLTPLVLGFNRQSRDGEAPTTRARGRPKKAEVIRLVR